MKDLQKKKESYTMRDTVESEVAEAVNDNQNNAYEDDLDQLLL